MADLVYQQQTYAGQDVPYHRRRPNRIWARCSNRVYLDLAVGIPADVIPAAMKCGRCFRGDQ